LLFPSERTTLESAALVTPQPQESAVEGRR
jgi:hypothetical protein